MAHVVDEDTLIRDLTAARGILSEQSNNFLLIVSHRRNGITQEQFRILNEMHDEVLKTLGSNK